MRSEDGRVVVVVGRDASFIVCKKTTNVLDTYAREVAGGEGEQGRGVRFCYHTVYCSITIVYIYTGILIRRVYCTRTRIVRLVVVVAPAAPPPPRLVNERSGTSDVREKIAFDGHKIIS